MNNITSQFPLAGFSSRQAPLSEFRSAGYVKEQSYRSQESLNTGLVIQTKDGDQVTLTSNSFSEMDAYMYDSKGVVQTDSGTAAFSHNVREVTLASGQSFSFTVEGDLSEEELEDIDSIIQGLDGVISEMKDGDMSGALDKAINIGNFDTVSSYAADISYQRSYEMSSAVSATATQFQPAAEQSSEEQPLAAPAAESSPELNPFQGKKKGLMDFDKFFKKMIKQFEAHEDKQIGLAKDPINKLFKHHLDEIGQDDDASGSIYSALETAMNDIDSLIQEKMNSLFNDQLAEFAKPEVSAAPAEPAADEDN